MKTETITIRPDTTDVRQAIVTRFLSPTNTRGSRIRATCSRGSIVIGYPDELSGAACHAEAVAQLLARFAKEDGSDKSFGRARDWVCGGMPEKHADSYVFVRLPR